MSKSVVIIQEYTLGTRVPPLYRKYYLRVEKMLRGLGYSSIYFCPLDQPPPYADLWVSHGDGVRVLKYAPYGTKTMDLGLFGIAREHISRWGEMAVRVAAKSNKKKVFALIQKHGFQSVEMWDDDADNLRAVEKVCVRVGVPFVAHKETAREESAEGSEEAYNELIKTWGKTANQAFKITEGALKRYFTTGRPRSVFVTLEDGSPVDITSLRYEREANLLLKGYFSSDPSDQEEVYAHINHLGQIGQGWIY